MTTRVDTYLCRIRRASEPIQAAATKLGGIPIFLDEADWPTCKHCGSDMDFLAQISLRTPIRFSTQYEMAYVFMCPGKFDARGWLQCRTWDPYAGANAVFLQKGSRALMVSSRVPAYPDYVVTLSHAREALIDTSDFEGEESLLESISESTKIGGVPLWLQSSEVPVCPACGGPMVFVAQIDAALDGPLPANPANWDGEKFRFLQFGDAGIGYLFICENECGTDGAAFLWQCT